MQYQAFKDLLHSISTLTSQQKNILRQTLSDSETQDPQLNLEEQVKVHFSKHPVCPHCHSDSYKLWGVREGRQRYSCKACSRTYNAFTGTPLARLRHPEKWQTYLEGMTHSLTLRPAARACGVTLKTSFRWRHRFLKVLESDQAQELGDIVEMDETLFRESFKGQRKDLPRPARKRGNDKKTNCRKVPVLVARDRRAHTVDGILENEGAQEMVKHLRGRISIEAVVCADASLAHESLARKLGFPLKELNTSAGERVLDGIFHIQHVNAYHSHLKGWLGGVFH
ncbi:IS1595 family transposase, partial [Sansalvadorimonas verongulae]|uniref:IS1595 family transposase n=1 Tax=Sansalvadorimonas verongulae TaxID=2172824 RepID=UPI0012BC80D9